MTYRPRRRPLLTLLVSEGHSSLHGPATAIQAVAAEHGLSRTHDIAIADDWRSGSITALHGQHVDEHGKEVDLEALARTLGYRVEVRDYRTNELLHA